MPQYLLNVYQPEGENPPPEVMGAMMKNVYAWRDEVKAAGAWVFGAGLQPTSTGAVVRPRNGEVLTTDGPFIESKEQVGGFIMIEAPDLDAALEWSRKLAAARTSPVEVRPVYGEVER